MQQQHRRDEIVIHCLDERGFAFRRLRMPESCALKRGAVKFNDRLNEIERRRPDLGIVGDFSSFAASFSTRSVCRRNLPGAGAGIGSVAIESTTAGCTSAIYSCPATPNMGE